MHKGRSRSFEAVVQISHKSTADYTIKLHELACDSRRGSQSRLLPLRIAVMMVARIHLDRKKSSSKSREMGKIVVTSKMGR